MGQSIGVMCSVVVMFGWWAAGPARYARAKDEIARQDLYMRSLQERLLVGAALAPFAAGLTYVLVSPEWRLDSTLMALAALAGGLSPSWYFIGAGQPWNLAKYETLPKVLAAAVAAILMLWTHLIWIYPTALLLVSLSAAVLFVSKVGDGRLRRPYSLRTLLVGLRDQLAVACTNIFGTIYSNAPVPAASLLSSGTAAAGFVSAHRLYGFSLFSIVALGNTLQSWTLEENENPAKRHKAAILAHGLLGGAGGVCFVVLGKQTTELLFGGAVVATQDACIGFGIAFALTSLSTPLTRNLLIPANRARVPLIATSFGAAVGLPLMFLLPPIIGLAGVSAALALSEALVLAFVLWPALRILRGFDSAKRSSAG